MSEQAQPKREDLDLFDCPPPSEGDVSAFRVSASYETDPRYQGDASAANHGTTLERLIGRIGRRRGANAPRTP